LNDFQKATDPKWDELLQFFDEQCKRTKVLVTTRKEDEVLRDLTGRQIFDVPKLPKEVAQDYLRAVGLSVDEATAVRIWEKCEGNPKAMKLFAQAARRRSIERVLALPLPAWHEGAAQWMDELLADLSEPAKEVAKRLSIFDEPVEEDLLLAIGATEEGLWELQDFRLAEKTEDERWQEHDLLREYWQTRLSDQERKGLASESRRMAKTTGGKSPSRSKRTRPRSVVIGGAKDMGKLPSPCLLALRCCKGSTTIGKAMVEAVVAVALR
jgi:ATP/maltotriose-dependent transcriptional regulator MalT